MKFYKKALIFIDNIVFPPCCLICGKQTNNFCCKECKKRIEKTAVYNIETIKQKQYYFTKHIYAFLYKNEIRNLILDYKFNDKSYLYKIFSKIIANNKKIYGILKKYDIIITVPIHKKRKKQRGYNQSELVAKEIANEIGIKCLCNCLVKCKDNKPQSTLRKIEREENVKNAYKIKNKDEIQNKSIILFDDIYTTGSTVNECARILYQNGAKEIIVLTIAKD